jgi:hypothetical protein
MPNVGIGTRPTGASLRWCAQHLSNVREHGSNKTGSAVPQNPGEFYSEKDNR